MDAGSISTESQDRSRALAGIGVLLLLGGVAVGLLGPIETYCFYLFSEGGPFHYEGFGFGSFMFGNIAGQIVGYYLIAGVFIVLGYGHLRMRRWIRPLSLTLLWSWLVIGAPLIAVAFFILAGSKDLSLPLALLAAVLLALSYLVLPALLSRFYQSRNVRDTLETRDDTSYWVEKLPLPLLVLTVLLLFYIVVLHLLILFNGIFPLFGAFRFGLEGIVWIEITMACLVVIVWGTLHRRAWAWWGSVIWLGLFACSTLLTLVRASYAAILSGLAFPQREMEFLGGLPFEGYHFAILVGPPLLVTWGLAFLAKRHFRGMGGGSSSSESPLLSDATTMP